MKSKRFLFFPLEIGIAHTARSLALAEKLHKKKHKVLVALPKFKQKIFSDSPIEFVDIGKTSKRQDLHVVESFKNIDILIRLIKQEKEIIKKFKPDCCIVDFRLSAIVAAKQLNTPIFFITGSGGLPYGTYIPNPGFPNILYKVSRPLLEYFIDKIKLNYFLNLDQVSKLIGREISIKKVIREITFIIPEIPIYLPLNTNDFKKYYCGPLNWNGFLNKRPIWLDKIRPNGKTLYLTFGGTGFDKKIFVDLTQALINSEYRVITSCSTLVNPEEFANNKNLYIERYLPGPEVSKKVDLIVCHGGYGSLTDASLAGKPAITIPFNPDQLLHSLRYQELGLGLTTAKFQINYLSKLLSWDWLGFEKIGQKVNIGKVVNLIGQVLEDKDKFSLHINKYKSQLEEKMDNFNIEQLFR